MTNSASFSIFSRTEAEDGMSVRRHGPLWLPPPPPPPPCHCCCCGGRWPPGCHCCCGGGPPCCHPPCWCDGGGGGCPAIIPGGGGGGPPCPASSGCWAAGTKGPALLRLNAGPNQVRRGAPTHAYAHARTRAHAQTRALERPCAGNIRAGRRWRGKGTHQEEWLVLLTSSPREAGTRPGSSNA